MTQRWRKLQWLWAIIGGFLIQLTMGAVYNYGKYGLNCDIIQPKNSTAILKGLTRCEKNIMHIYLFSMFGSSSTMSLGGYIKDKVGVGITIIIGCFIFNIGIFCYTFINYSSDWGYIISYGFVSGLGAGLMISVSISGSCKHFTNKGLAVGITMSGFAMGQLFLYFLRIVIKSAEAYFGILSASYILIQLTSCFLLWISERSPLMGLSVTTPILFETEKDVEVKPHKLIFQYDFWIIWITFLLNAPGSIIIISLQRIIGEVETSPLNLTVWVYLNCIVQVFGRILWGFLTDRFEYNNIVTAMSLVSTSSSIISSLFFELNLPNKQLHHFYNAVMILNYFCQSGTYSVFPSIIVKRFGQQYFDKNYGLLWTAYSVAGIIISGTISALNRSWLGLTKLCTVIAVLHFISCLMSQAYVGKNRKIPLQICGYRIS